MSTSRRFLIMTLVALAVFPAVLTSCASTARTKTPEQSDWRGDNAAKLARITDAAPAAGSPKRVAAFDCDNTLIKNDIGDATMYWLIRHDLIRAPRDWRLTSRYLTKDAIAALKRDCHAKGGFIQSSKDITCADTLLTIYNSEKLPSGKPAWTSKFNPDLTDPGFAWVASLLAGYTPAEAKQLAEQAFAQESAAPIGATQTVGSRTVAGYIRIYQPMKKLIADLQKHGVDVWIVSASPQTSIEVIASRLNVAPDHVIGIRNLLHHGKLAYTFAGCGPFRSGTQEIISLRQGKRCWLNQVVFGVKNHRKQMTQPSPTFLAAGDSDGDVFFVKDAREAHLVLNRHGSELMCNAYANTDGKWIVNPMFIDPMPQMKGRYSCSKFGLPDQSDTVF